MPLAKIRQFKPIPSGTYHFSLRTCKTKTAREKNEDFLAWTLEVLDDEELAGREVDWTSSNEFGRGSKAYAFLIACGMPPQDDEVDINTDDFIGCEFYAVVSQKPADVNGVVRNKFESFMSVEAFEKAAAKHSARPVARQATAAPVAAPAPAAQELEQEAQPEPEPEAPAPAPAAAPVRKPTVVTAKPTPPRPATAPSGGALKFPK